MSTKSTNQGGPSIDREEVLEHSKSRFRARLTISFEGRAYDLVAFYDVALNFAWVRPLDEELPVRVERAARSFVPDFYNEVTSRRRGMN